MGLRDEISATESSFNGFLKNKKKEHIMIKRGRAQEQTGDNTGPLDPRSNVPNLKVYENTVYLRTWDCLEKGEYKYELLKKNNTSPIPFSL